MPRPIDNRGIMNPRAGLLGGALAFYLVWTAATWVFEGRIDTLLRPEATGDRIVYAFVVNLLFGIAGGLAFLRHWVRRGTLEPQRVGFGPVGRAASAIAAGLALGLSAYVLQGAPSLNPVVIVNAFSQVFVVSAAEVLVCWGLVGAAVEAGTVRGGRVMSLGVAAVVAAVLFGLYHFAHSAPFNTLRMVLLLTVVGLVTGAFFFLSRDLAGTIVFHNFLGTFGVVQALSAAGALASLERLQPTLVLTAAISAAFLAAGYAFLRRAARPV